MNLATTTDLLLLTLAPRLILLVLAATATSALVAPAAAAVWGSVALRLLVVSLLLDWGVDREGEGVQGVRFKKQCERTKYVS